MRCRRWIGAWALGLLVIGGALAIAEEGKPASGKDETLVVKEKGGTRFLSLSDWPTARKGGVVKAAPLEEYLSMKFGQVRARFVQMDTRIAGLEQQIAQLEKGQRELLKGLKLFEERLQQQEASDGDQAKDHSEAQSSGTPSQQ